jgi:hypothetical protein
LKKKVNKVNTVVFLVLLCIVLSIAFVVFLKSRNIDPFNMNINEISKKVFNLGLNNGQTYVISEISYDKVDNPEFCIYKDSLIVCVKNNIRAYDKKGTVLWNRNITADEPLTFTNGSELLIADKGGRNVYVFYGNEIKWEKRLDEIIINAHINKKGYVTLVQEKEGYKGSVRILDNKGIEVLLRAVAQNHIVSAVLSPSSKFFIINSINTSEYNVITKLEFIEMYKKEPFAAITYENEMVPAIKYLNDDSFITVSDMGAVYYDDKRDRVFEYEMNMINGAGILLDRYIALAESDDKGSNLFDNKEGSVVIFNKEGQKKAGFNVKENILNINTCSDIISVNTGREIYFIDIDGNIESKYGSNTDIINVYFFNKKEVCIIKENKIEILRIGG